ncbi:DUF3653 domain-containing protein, partial [Xanthomonas vesicatoria]
LTGQWAGFSFQNGQLITPEGRGIAPADLRWLSLTCTIAREWATMMAEGRARKPPARPAGVVYLRDELRTRRKRKAGLQWMAEGVSGQGEGSSLPRARNRKGRV